MEQQWVLFSLAGQPYCTATASVREIITYRPANPIPGAPPGVEGIVIVRKDKITLYSGHALVLNQPSPPREDGHIILLDSVHGLVGVAVDSVEGVVQLDAEQIEPWQNESWQAGSRTNATTARRANPLLGTVNHKGQLVTAVSLTTFCENAVAEDCVE